MRNFYKIVEWHKISISDSEEEYLHMVKKESVPKQNKARKRKCI